MDGPVSGEGQRSVASVSRRTIQNANSAWNRELTFPPDKLACGSKEFDPPFPFPPGASRGGDGSPHAGSTLLASQKRWPASMLPAPPTSKAPAWRGSIRERNFVHAAVHGRLIEAQVVEVGRSLSGAVKTEHKRGPKFRAPYSGYSLRQHPRLIPIRRLLPYARLGLYLSRKDHRHVPTEEAFAETRPGEARCGPRQKGWKTDRDVPGRSTHTRTECSGN
jgi:hypothetical protein